MLKQRIQNWYGKYERPISSLALVGGFILDALTIRMVSLFWQNIWITCNLIIISVCIVLVHVRARNEGDEGDSSKLHFWLVNILQFFFGSTLSTFLVFYFNSSDFFVSWPFLLVLALSFWANEKFKRSYIRLSFQISLLFLAIYAFTIFLVPIALHKIGTGVFILSGGLALLAISFILYIIKYFAGQEFIQSKKIIYTAILSTFFVVNVLYFGHLIPPIPLSLREDGVYHSLKRGRDGNYLVILEPYNWKNYFKLYPEFHKAPGETVYVYSAIFSPPQFKTTIIHEWQHKNEISGNWETVNKLNLPIVGGRDGGFRTYSQKTNISEGKWRVNVLTQNGLVIGRVKFKVIFVNDKPVLIEDVKK